MFLSIYLPKSAWNSILFIKIKIPLFNNIYIYIYTYIQIFQIQLELIPLHQSINFFYMILMRGVKPRREKIFPIGQN